MSRAAATVGPRREIAPSDADLDDAIRQAERTLADLQRQRTDRDGLRVVTALARVVGGGIAFSSVDLIKHSRLVPELRAMLGDMTPRQVGALLKRIAALGPTSSGVVLRRVTRNEDGCIWELLLTG